MSKLVKKICLIGPEGVGKTSLIKRFIDNSFDEKYRSTIGVQISQKLVELNADQSVELMIWDLEGFDISKDYPMSYLLGAATFIFVADISRPNTISELISIYSRITPNTKIEVAPLIAINKIDLVSSSEHETVINKLKASTIFSDISSFHLTSAKLGDSVEDVFKSIAQHIYSK